MPPRQCNINIGWLYLVNGIMGFAFSRMAIETWSLNMNWLEELLWIVYLIPILPFVILLTEAYVLNVRHGWMLALWTTAAHYGLFVGMWYYEGGSMSWYMLFVFGGPGIVGPLLNPAVRKLLALKHHEIEQRFDTCAHCGYILYGTNVSRCPECGEPTS